MIKGDLTVIFLVALITRAEAIRRDGSPFSQAPFAGQNTM